MSYNIDSWRTKEINNLVIPMIEVEGLPYVRCEYAQDGFSFCACGVSEGFDLQGTVKNGMLEVSVLTHFGEGSGHEWEDIKEMLSKSSGTLIATQVWEGGDSFSRLTVKDGDVKSVTWWNQSNDYESITEEKEEQIEI